VRRGTILKKENIAECERNLNINDLLHPYQIPEVVYDATTTSELQKAWTLHYRISSSTVTLLPLQQALGELRASPYSLPTHEATSLTA
jgi:hypothetical protein